MPRYAFTSNQGRFLIPDGESRIGSDSSCPVCVRGDGILPVHAYLKLDGNKLTIRPSSEKATVLVDGKPLAGPETIALGQTVVIGPLQLKLESESGPGKPFWHRRWVRGTVYAASAVLVLVLLAVLLRLVWFNDAWFKAKITAQIQSALMREEAQIERVDVSLLDGTLAVHNLRVENNMAFLAKGDLLKVERIDGSLNAWDFLSSWIQGTPEITSGKLNVVRPKIFIELNDRGLSNVDDILREYLTVQQPRLKPFDLGLASLDAEVTVEDGLVQINDEYTGTGVSALEGLNIDVTQKGFADNLKVALSAKTNAGGEARGTIALDLAFRLINPRGEIATEDIGDGTAQLTFESVDFGRICRHLRLDLPVYGDDKTELKLVPGKPATGEFAVNFHDLKQFHINGDLKSESLVSVIERDKPAIGNLPAYLEIKTLNYDLQKGPLNMDVTLRGAKTLAAAMSPAADHILTLTAEGKHNSGGEYAYSSRYELKLADFGETDVGQRLGLRDALKGTLSGTLTQVRELKEGKRSLSIDATMGLSSDAQVLVGSGPNAVWQPCRFAVGLKADAKPNDAGELDSLLAEFSAKSDSFLVNSLKPMKVTSLDNLTALSIDSRFHLALKGREFTKEFQPILALMNLRVPEEILDLDVMVLTDRGEDEEIADLRGQRRIRLGIEGKAERQWQEQTSPQSLFLMLRYLPELHQAAQRARAGDVAAAKHPYLKLEFLTEAKEQDPIKIHVTNATVRGAGDQVILSIPHEIESNLLAVHERYHPYLERIFSSLGPQALEAYREHVLAGFLKQKGDFTVAYTPAAGADSRPDLEVAFNLTTSGKDLAIEGPVPGTTPQQKKRWNWTEPSPDVTLKGRYVSRPASTKEEQDIQRLDLEKVEVKQSRVGQFNLSAGEVDLWLIGQLANHARLRKVWPDALGTFHFEGTVQEDAFRLLQMLNLLPPAPDVAGTMKLDVDFDRKQDRVKLNPFIYRLAEAPSGAKGSEDAFWFKEASMAADFRNVRKFFEDMDAQQANPLMHLGQRLTVKSITLDAPGFVTWTQKYPEQAKLAGLPPSLLESLGSQSFVPREQWLVRNFALTPGPNENSWSILGQFKTPFYFKFPFIGADEKYPPVLVVAGDWSIDESDAAGLSLTKDFENPTLYLGANFERTGIALRNLVPDWNYEKPADQLL
ncbi:MAG: FHA domain-containing protein, partial [Planctomycetes bacterium]|nr:FHA domain-containing protein [Planctomycetota bacterium]